MLYECTAKNCRLTEAGFPCLNRPFAELQERREAKNAFRPKDPAEKPGPNMYSEGVEVFKTQDRGHGVRAMRSFEPNQVIVEYNGEVVTLDESDRRTNEVYKGKNVSIVQRLRLSVPMLTRRFAELLLHVLSRWSDHRCHKRLDLPLRQSLLRTQL